MEAGLSMLYLETPTNPLLRVIDIKPLAEAAHQKGAVVVLQPQEADPVIARRFEHVEARLFDGGDSRASAGTDLDQALAASAK